MSRPYDPTNPREIERLKKLFGLPSDYNIAITVDDDESKNCGDVTCSVDYHSVCIKLHRKSIEKEHETYTDTTLKETTYHEFAEIVAFECMGVLPRRQFHSKSLDRVRDRFADALKRTVMRLEK